MMLLVILNLLYLFIIISSGSNNTINQYYYDNWCGGDLKYLDDSECVKKFPSNIDRNYQCNTKIYEDSNEINLLLQKGYNYDTQQLYNINVDIEKLLSLITTNANVCVILTKRIKVESKIELLNKYYCAGNHSRDEGFETWSSSKIFAIANGGSRLRSNETNCINDLFGITSNTTGKNGISSLGDFTTIICSYDNTKGYTSNSLASYFHDLGWRQQLNNLINSDWIGLTSSGQTLGGNYGEATPSDLSYDILNNDVSCNADKDPWPTIYSNTISSLTAAELTRRIALHRELKEYMRWPHLIDDDIINILNGEQNSIYFDNQINGGMSADTSIFVQSALSMEEVENKSAGTWRIFSKLGDGYSTSRNRGEIVNNAYVCLPGYDVEFTISVRGSVTNDYDLSQAESVVMETVKEVVEAIITEKL